MSKVIAVSAMGAGGTGVALTGAYAMGLFGGVDYEIPKTFEKFKTEEMEGCIKEVFPTLEGGKKIGDLTSSLGDPNTGDATLGNDTNANEQPKGCLVVSWDKWKSSDSKWKGNFRFLWSFSKGKKGFVVYTSVITPAEKNSQEEKFLVQGGAYVLTKDNDKWSFTKKLEVPTTGTKKLDKSDWNNEKLPKQGSALANDFKSASFWNLLEADLNKDELCGDTGCDTKYGSFRGYWTWKPKESGSDQAQEKNLGDWSSDVGKWWKEIYGEDKWKMQDTIKDIKGEWIEKHFSGISRASTSTTISSSGG